MYHWHDYIKSCLFVLIIITVSCNNSDNVVENVVGKNNGLCDFICVLTDLIVFINIIYITFCILYKILISLLIMENELLVF